MTRPKVTALVPSYNAAAFLQATLDSLAAQTWDDLEILIGDDCSTDATPAVIAAFAAADPRVRVLPRAANLGWLRNSNDLMAHAAGEFCFFAFHDDILLPAYVERLAGALLARPAAILAYSDMEVFTPELQKSEWRYQAIDGPRGSVARGLAMARRGDGWWVPNRGLFRTRAFRAIGGIKPNACGEYSADWTWLLHMALLGEFVRVPEILCRKYYKAASISRAWPHDRAQREALLRAGIAEVAGSGADRTTRALLEGYLRFRLLRSRGGAVRDALRPGAG